MDNWSFSPNVPAVIQARLSKNGAARYGEEEKTSSSRVVKRRRSHTEDDGER